MLANEYSLLYTPYVASIPCWLCFIFIFLGPLFHSILLRVRWEFRRNNNQDQSLSQRVLISSLFSVVPLKIMAQFLMQFHVKHTQSISTPKISTLLLMFWLVFLIQIRFYILIYNFFRTIKMSKLHSQFNKLWVLSLQSFSILLGAQLVFMLKNVYLL